MTLYQEGKEVFEIFNSNFTLLSSRLLKLEFDNQNENFIIKMQFMLMYPLNTIIMLEFSDIIDYGFVLNNDNKFYYLEAYKLIMVKNQFYISTDPFDESEIMSVEDNDFVLSNKIALYK